MKIIYIYAPLFGEGRGGKYAVILKINVQVYKRVVKMALVHHIHDLGLWYGK